jgi:hypothetical protein
MIPWFVEIALYVSDYFIWKQENFLVKSVRSAFKM